MDVLKEIKVSYLKEQPKFEMIKLQSRLEFIEKISDFRVSNFCQNLKVLSRV